MRSVETVGLYEILLRMDSGADVRLSQVLEALPPSVWIRLARLGDPVPRALARWNAAIESVDAATRERVGLRPKPARLPEDDPVERARALLASLPSGTERPAGDAELVQLGDTLASHARLRRWAMPTASPFSLLTDVDAAAFVHYGIVLDRVTERATATARAARARGRVGVARQFDALAQLARRLEQHLADPGRSDSASLR